MLIARDFREKSRAALSGNWAVGVGTGFVASLLGAGTIMVGSGGSSSSNSSSSSGDPNMFQNFSYEELSLIISLLLAVSAVALLWALVIFILGGPVTLGYVKFNLNLVDYKNAQFSDLFSQFNRFGEGFLVQFLRGLFVGLWSLIFIGPAIVFMIIGVVAVTVNGNSASAALMILMFLFLGLTIAGACMAAYKQFSYSMSAYILYENPGMGANNAIKESIQLMKGNKWRLFCLNFSFIGWAILCLFTLGIGLLWLKPYQEASYAAFYREIKRERYGEPVQTTYSNPYEQSSSFNTYKDSNF